jgi:hypothetical protein
MAEREDLTQMWEAVGMMTGNFAVLELALHHLVWEMLGHGPEVRVVIREKGFGDLLKVGQELVKEGFPVDGGHRKRADDVLRRLQRVNKHRNITTHATVGEFAGRVGLEVVREMIRGTARRRRVRVSDVQELCKASAELVAEVAQLTREIRAVQK